MAADRQLSRAELAKRSGSSGTTTRSAVVGTNGAIRATVEITLPGADDPAELWTITVENLSDASAAAQGRAVPRVGAQPARTPTAGHTQYNRLFAEMEYVAGLHAVLAWDKHSKAMGFLAADVDPDGFLTARVDFIGRARSLWSPRALETLAFFEARRHRRAPDASTRSAACCSA